MSRARAALTATIVTMAGASQGCGAADRPPPGVEDVATPADPGPLPQATAPERCAPGATRDCHLSYTDLLGQVHCPASTQICRPDGDGWLPCGERSPADAGSSGVVDPSD
jgi:hypothetical protein